MNRPNDPAAGETASDPPALETLVFELLERGNEDPQDVLEALCREHPEQAAELRRGVSMLRSLGLMREKGEERSPRPEIPKRLGDFTILRHLGGGGMGVVYGARQESLGREVALKLVRPEHLYFGDARERFQREVTTVARLNHPGIVPVYAVGEELGVPYFAMELVRGVTLADALSWLGDRSTADLEGADLDRAIASLVGEEEGEERAPLFAGDWPETCQRIVREVAEALEHAHRLGVIHRDLKPSNIMVTRGGRVMLVDFGLSSDEAADRITRTGSQAGSLPYMAPEQLSGERRPDRRSDVYGLGVTLYEILTLRLPYRGGTYARLRQRVLEGRPTRIRRINPAVSWEAETACLVAMEPEAERRYASAGDLARDLTNVLEKRPIAARRASPLLRAQRWSQRHPARAVAGALGSLLVVGGPSLYAWQQHEANVRIGEKNVEIATANIQLTEANVRIGEKNVEIATANIQLTQALADVEEQRDAARLEMDRAEKNLALGIQAVERMLARVEAKLRWVPQMEPIRRELLKHALVFFEVFLEESDSGLPLDFSRALWLEPRDPGWLHQQVAQLLELLGDDARAEAFLVWHIVFLEEEMAENGENDQNLEALATALSKLSEIHRRLARFAEAEEAYTRVVDIVSWLCDRYPANAILRYKLFRAREGLAQMFRHTGRREEAKECLRRNLEILDSWPPALPRSSRLLAALTSSLVELSTLVQESGRFEEAEELLRRALPLTEESASTGPAERLYLHERAQFLTELGLVCFETDRWVEAETYYREGLAIAEHLLADHPNVQVFQDGLVTTLINHGAALLALEDYAGAERALLRGVETAEAVHAATPEVPELSYKLATAKGSLADLKRLTGVPDEAIQLLDESIRLLVALEAAPGSPDCRRMLSMQRSCLAEVHLDRKRHVEAAAATREMLETRPDSADDRFVGALFLARCSRIAATDDALTEEERAELARSYVEEAIDLLASAIELGFRDLSALESEKDLEPLREHPRFSELFAHLK